MEQLGEGRLRGYSMVTVMVWVGAKQELPAIPPQFSLPMPGRMMDATSQLQKPPPTESTRSLSGKPQPIWQPPPLTSQVKPPHSTVNVAPVRIASAIC